MSDIPVPPPQPFERKWFTRRLFLALVYAAWAISNLVFDFHLLQFQKELKAREDSLDAATGRVTVAAAAVMNRSNEYRDAAPIEVKDRRYVEALDSAVRAWHSALGREIRKPKLLRYSSIDPAETCNSGDAIACVNVAKNFIFVTSTLEDEAIDPRTVMMHEIGHLLGVPHIDGDQLMNRAYLGMVPWPTDAAIALANLNSVHVADLAGPFRSLR